MFRWLFGRPKGSGESMRALSERVTDAEVRLANLETRYADLIRKQALRAARAAKDGVLLEELAQVAAKTPQARPDDEAALFRKAFG